jgi:glycosyltransferase involved in cell wall biosynthesis
MKVAILLTDMITSGGAPRQAMLLAQWLQKFGHEATVYSNRYCPEVCFPEIGASLDIRAVARLSPADVDRRNRGRHHGLARGAKRHLWESSQLASLVREPYDILNPHVRGATRAAVECKRRTGAPVVWMCDDARNWESHGYRPYYWPPVQWCFDRLMSRLERPVVRKINRIVALDHRVQEILESYYHRPAEVIRSGLDAVEFRPHPEARDAVRARHGIGTNDFLLLWLGIIEPHRRLEDALEALRLLRLHGRDDVRLLIAGTPEFSPGYVRRLQQIVARYQLGDLVRFHLSRVPENEMPDYYSAADSLVYLAENQCWALGIFEAMACDLPAIVSRACGAHEVLEDRRTAMLVAPRSSAEFASAIAALADTPGLAATLAKEARLRVLSQITWEGYARNMLLTFERVLGETAAAALATHREVFA